MAKAFLRIEEINLSTLKLYNIPTTKQFCNISTLQQFNYI